MRRVHLTDLNIATRVLMAVTTDSRQHIVQRLIRNAQTADKYRKKTGRAHPEWGAGSLGDACIGHTMAPLARGCDAPYLECLSTVVTALRMK